MKPEQALQVIASFDLPIPPEGEYWVVVNGKIIEKFDDFSKGLSRSDELGGILKCPRGVIAGTSPITSGPTIKTHE